VVFRVGPRRCAAITAHHGRKSTIVDERSHSSPSAWRLAFSALTTTWNWAFTMVKGLLRSLTF